MPLVKYEAIRTSIEGRLMGLVWAWLKSLLKLLTLGRVQSGDVGVGLNPLYVEESFQKELFKWVEIPYDRFHSFNKAYPDNDASKL